MVYETSEQDRHWLVDVAKGAGLPDLQLGAGAPVSHLQAAWAEVSRSAGISETELATRVAGHFQLDVADLETIQPLACKLLPEHLARKHGALPIRATDQTIVLATSDPVNRQMEHDVLTLSGREPVFEIAAPGPLSDAIDASYGRTRMVEFVLQNLAAEAARDTGEATNPRLPGESMSARPVGDLVSHVLRSAVRVGANQVLIEPGARGGHVTFRVDGEVERFMHLPSPALVRIVRRFKELADLDVDVRVRMQEGRTSTVIADHPYTLRIRTEPASPAERVSIRIMDPDHALPLERLGLPGPEVDRLSALLRNRTGLIVLAGPPRSGLSHLMVAIARAQAAGERRVTIVDTRVDLEVEDVTQIQAEPGEGSGFRVATQQALEEHPDVLVLPKMPDRETARELFEAATSSTLVVAGVEATTVGEVIERLTNLGVSRGRVADALVGVAQHRLIRRLCPECSRDVIDRARVPATERSLAAAYNTWPTRLAAGCSSCRMTGFRGRLLLTSTANVTSALSGSIATGTSASEIDRSLAEGASSLFDAALARVTAGHTLLGEVLRVLEPPEVSVDPDTSRQKVLVVDDNPEIGLLMHTVLSDEGFHVNYVRDGQRALEHLSLHDDTALIILDLRMPGLSGREVLDRVRENRRTAHLPVVILTADEDPGREIELLAAGADDYLIKPVDTARARARVRAVLQRTGAQASRATEGKPLLVVAD